MITTWLVIAIVAIMTLWIIYAFNRLVSLRARIDEAFSDIDVQLKRRHDLIPNLVETVKGYMAHEKDVFEKVTQARAAAMGVASNATAQEKIQKENALSNTLKTLFAVAENYPDLKANANFLDLQRELADAENKIQAARRFYNGNVMDYNVMVDTFPSHLIASSFGFNKREFFEVTNENEREPVQVKF